MDLHDELLQSFAEDLKIKGKKPSTIESYSHDAIEFIRYIDMAGLGLREVVPETLLAYQAHLSAFDRENSVRRKVIGTRQFFRFLSDRQGDGESPLDHVPIPERNDELPAQLPARQIKQLLAHLGRLENLKGRRDLALTHLLGWEGLKASELIQLEWSDWLESGPSSSLRIRSSRSRTICLAPETHRVLSLYRLAFNRLEKQRKQTYQNMFVAFKGRDASIVLETMTRHGLKFLLYELGQLVGFKKLNTELLRHHAVNVQLQQGHSPEAVMNHLGLRRIGNIARHLHQLNQKL